jgi:hypothetical protein
MARFTVRTIHTPANYKTSNKNRIVLLWTFFLFVMWYMAAMCETNDNLDLGRYYYNAIAQKNTSVKDIIEQANSRGVDFIYQVILHWGVVFSIPLNLITAFFVTLYYAIIVSCVRFFYRGKMEWYVMAAVLFLTPITWIIAISRNLTAIAFLYIGLNMLYKRKWFWMCLFCIAGLLTHFSVLLYVVLFAAAYLLKNLRLTIPIIAAVILGAIVISSLVPDYLYNIMGYFLEGSEMVYATTYVGRMGASFFSWSNIGLGDKVPIFYSLIFSSVILMANRKQGTEFWMLLLLTIVQQFFLRSSLLFTNRCMMIMPIFWAVNVAQIYSNCTSRTKFTIQILSLIAFFLIFLHIYSYRVNYFPFLF